MHRERVTRRNAPGRLLAMSVVLGACTGRITSSEPEPGRGAQGGSAEMGDAGIGAEQGAGGARGLTSAPSDAAPAGSAGSAGSPGPVDAGASAPPSRVDDAPVCDAVSEVLLVSCGGGSCHSNRDARIGDWAVGAAEAESFVDVPSVRNVDCGLIIDSSDPSNSLLLRKLIGDFPSPMCGGFMPVSGPDLTDRQIDCMRSWLQQFRR